MKKGIFRRSFILYLVVLLFSTVLINFYLAKLIRKSYLHELEQGLSAQTSLIADIFLSSKEPSVDAFCRKIKEKVGARITVISSSGKVLGDSDRDASTMENHGNRPEIQQALLSPSGSSMRFSDTLKEDFFYSARSIRSNGKDSGFIRLAVPLSEVNKTINRVRMQVTFAVIAVYLLFGLLLTGQTEKIRKHVQTIADFSGALARGLFRKRLYLENAGEFTELAHNLNNMASELEVSLKEREEESNRLSVIVKTIPDALLLIGVDGTVELSNTAARELLAHDQLDGRTYLEVVRNPSLIRLIDEVKQSLTPGSAEMTLFVTDEKHMFVRVFPLFYKVAELAGVVVLFHDTTKMKKLEQMRQDFVANVSHEIKTPVTAIQGYAETLLDGALEDKDNAEKFLRTIQFHSVRLNRLVDDLLTLSKIELGAIMIRKKDVHVSDIIDSVVNTVLIQAEKKNLAIRKTIDSEESVIHADRDRTEQILLNLAVNAIKFTDQGEIEIGVSREKGKGVLFVRDTGQGIPRKYLGRLGERFFRVDPSRSRDLGGTGLGLAIVKHLVKAHDWDLTIESEVGKGTVVKIFYPLGPSAP